MSEFAAKITTTCDHERDVCRACISSTIDLEVKGKNNTTKILCPHVGCPGQLEHSDVLREATQSVFERYDQLLLRSFLQDEPNFRWCSHPGCGGGQIVDDLGPGVDGARNRFMRCHACNKRTCAHHRCPWHTERTCDEYDKDGRGSDEVALLQYLERGDVQRCPKCHHGIEKAGGCDHMTCSGCGAEFCMRCLADYKGPQGIWKRGNSAHKKSCPFYFRNPEEDEDEEQ